MSVGININETEHETNGPSEKAGVILLVFNVELTKERLDPLIKCSKIVTLTLFFKVNFLAMLANK